MSTGSLETAQAPETAWGTVCRHARELFAALDSLDVASLSAAQRVECLALATRMENVGHARAVATVAVVESKGDAARLGAGTTTALLATRVGWAPGRIRSILSTSGVFAEHPEVAAAGCAGKLSSVHTGEITRGLQAAEGLRQRPAPSIARDLLRTALTQPLSELRARVRDLKYSIDPWRAQDDLAHARARSYAKFGATRTGIVRFEALLDPERGALLRTAIEATVAEWLRHNALDSTPSEHAESRARGGDPAEQTAPETDTEAARPTIRQLTAQALTDIAAHYFRCDADADHAGSIVGDVPSKSADASSGLP